MPSSMDLPDPGMEPASPVFPALLEILYPLSDLGSPTNRNTEIQRWQEERYGQDGE